MSIQIESIFFIIIIFYSRYRTEYVEFLEQVNIVFMTNYYRALFQIIADKMRFL